MNPKIYLAGPIQHADDGGHGWRTKVIMNYFKLDFLNPLDFFDGGEDKATIIPEDMVGDYEKDEEEFIITDEELVQKDKQMIGEADALLVGFPEKVFAWGTPMEQIYAWQSEISESKPIAVWHGEIDFMELSPWLRYHATFLSDSLEECVKYLEAELDVVPLCVSCRGDYGANLDGVSFTMMDVDCSECKDHIAMQPQEYV